PGGCGVGWRHRYGSITAHYSLSQFGRGASALIIVAFGAFVSPEIGRASSLGARLSAFEIPLLTKLLYGGITEELLTRWGLVSLFAWLGWRLSGRPECPKNSIFWIAIAGSALLFALGHLALLMLITPNPQSWLVAAVLLGNAIPGILFGWLFWRKGKRGCHPGAHPGANAGAPDFFGPRLI
ncbi:MAG: CPBP family intramembrane metalloprotease, partial [Sphingomonas bacterium]|nr:CPBP family intramembrane metalloprotease [Sphingomonas bacterium]